MHLNGKTSIKLVMNINMESEQSTTQNDNY